jgi:hypothetical protein
MSIIFNATFETGTDTLGSWFNSTVTQDTGDAHGGSGSLLVTSTGTPAGVNSNNYPYNSGVTGGNSYDLSFWHKLDAASPIATGNVFAKVRWYDGAVADLGTSDFAAVNPGGSWAQESLTGVTAPVGAVTFGWEIVGGDNTSIYRLDDVILQDTVVGSGPRPAIVMPGLAATQAANW